MASLAEKYFSVVDHLNELLGSNRVGIGLVRAKRRSIKRDQITVFAFLNSYYALFGDVVNDVQKKLEIEAWR